MDNLNKILQLLFSQQPSVAISSNPALKGLTTEMIDKNANDLSGVLSPSLFQKAAVPGLISGSILSTLPGSIPKVAGMGIDALSLLSLLSQ